MSLKIGITESTDPRTNHSWVNKADKVDGLILVTKGLATHEGFIEPDMKRNIISTMKRTPIILHCTCTGWGDTKMEPGVPKPEATMMALERLIADDGFPAENVVLRLDPIIPTKEGLERAAKVLDLLAELNSHMKDSEQKITRVRVSIADNYKHVMKRFQRAGYEPLYNGKFQADAIEMSKVIRLLKAYPGFEYSCCAETKLAKMSDGFMKAQGCISSEDLDIMGIPSSSLPKGLLHENPQNRKGCHCLSCKTELLGKSHECVYGCLYCYWKKGGDL